MNPDNPILDPYYLTGAPFMEGDLYTVKFPAQIVNGVQYGATELGFNFTFQYDSEYTIPITSELSVGLSADKTLGNVPLTVNFTCTMHGGQLPYGWALEYGDGTSDSGTRATEGQVYLSHTYTQVGTYTATLTVTDALGASIINRSAIRVGALTIVTPIIIMVAQLVTGLLLIRSGK